MSLIRCPGCKIDTSDSLAHCPNCGIAIGGRGPRLFDHRPATTQSHPTPPPISHSVPTPMSHPTPAGQAPAVSLQLGGGTKAILFVIGLLLIALLPATIPLVVMAVVFWFLAKRQKATPQVEALKILVSEVTRARSGGQKQRPLDMLRQIEERLRNQRNV